MYRREGSKIMMIGQPAAKLRTGEGSTTIQQEYTQASGSGRENDIVYTHRKR